MVYATAVEKGLLHQIENIYNYYTFIFITFKYVHLCIYVCL